MFSESFRVVHCLAGALEAAVVLASLIVSGDTRPASTDDAPTATNRAATESAVGNKNLAAVFPTPHQTAE